LAATESVDDRLRGNKRGDELPDRVADRQKRIAGIAEAKAGLKAEYWSGRRESNPRMQLGKLPFYH
jgi:hypothetical protein